MTTVGAWSRARHKGGASGRQPSIERVLHRCRVAGAHQFARDLRTADRRTGPGRRRRQHSLNVRGNVERCQPARDRPDALNTQGALSDEQRRQRLALGIEEVAQHVDVTAIVDRRDLDAGNDADALRLRGRRDFRKRSHGVVIGDADGRESRRGDAGDELDRRQPPVGRRRVHVQVDQRLAG